MTDYVDDETLAWRKIAEAADEALTLEFIGVVSRSCLVRLAASARRASGGRAVDQETARMRERAHMWSGLALDERHRLILQVLGDRRLTVTEIADRLNTLHDDWKLRQHNVKTTIRRLHDRGDLHRIQETYRNRPRYRYFHPTELSGEIAELERAFYDQDEDKR